MTGVALVTGASRGIGRAAAVALARAGFDVAVTARTMHEGQGLVEPDSVHGREAVAVPGSLERTAAEIEALGRRALPLTMDFRDLATVEAVPRTVVERWGGVDVLVNNGLYRGPGTMDRLADLRMEDLDRLMRGNFAYQVRLIQLVLPGMLERGHGRIIDMVSGSARHDPPGPAGEGGWGIAYAASKAALGRVAGGVNAEYAERGVWAFNVDPGNVVTERRRALHPDQDFTEGFGSDSPEVTAATIAWLASSSDAERFLGRWVFAPKLAEDFDLLG